ncbi:MULTISPECIES: DUF2267 domain-containing protein [unclassified Phenylobacterium]|uniref:DUF2267 domain-containing protein n=1 Tax=unclassified Phenylobacterium TaxID=2640670 RepID=UPI0022B5878C|nr:DUF2267 domain-containing protein [Phenylobacterium sp. NIBR 498073]WGU41270.1 DUF2267 domain-containing protein [Phenylobacterium sp. NIBR 498073]
MTTGLAVFDTTVQETNAWLNQIEAGLPPCGKQDAYQALRTVLHVLRDRLPHEAVLGLSAQLPMLIRGFFLEGWEPESPLDIHDAADFADEVETRLPEGFPRAGQDVAQAVFAVLRQQLDPGEVSKLARMLPKGLRPVLQP